MRPEPPHMVLNYVEGSSSVQSSLPVEDLGGDGQVSA